MAERFCEFFHGYYRSFCYLPLYIFCGEHLLCARLRKADQDGAAGTREELRRIIGRVSLKVAFGFNRDVDRNVHSRGAMVDR